MLQAWMMWDFINFHLRKRREREAELALLRKKKNKQAKKAKQDDDVSELPEVDQNTRRMTGMVTQRAGKGQKK